MVALLAATATVIRIVVLTQMPTVKELAGVVLVIDTDYPQRATALNDPVGVYEVNESRGFVGRTVSPMVPSPPPGRERRRSC